MPPFARLLARLAPAFAVALGPRLAVAGGPSAPSPPRVESTSADVEGELIVDLRDDLPRDEISDLFARLAVSFVPTRLEADTRTELVRVTPGRLDEVRGALERDPRVEIVEPNARVFALFSPNDPLLSEQWHLERIGAPRAWDLSTGRGVTVAVVDTGIACESFGPYTKASDLAQTRCTDGYNFVAGTEHANDDHGHGTHVAGTIAQSTNNRLGAAGVAFDAKLMPVKVLSIDGWGTTADVADGVRWAADHGAHVINLSLGGPRASRVLQKALDHARSRGVVVVAAAGNSGAAVQYPGGSEGVIGVSALDRQDRLAWFSSRGPGVDLAAPGVDVVQQTICNGGHDACEQFPSFAGTSMAAPHVAGTAALLVSLGVTEPRAVERALLGAARRLDDSAEGRARFGAGALDAAAAVTNLALARVVARLLALAAVVFLVFRWARKRGSRASPWHPGFLFGALLTGPGLFFFAPFLLSRHHALVDLFARPTGDWDLAFSASLHGYLPLANVLWPLLATLTLLGVRGARPVLAGACAGTAAFLTAAAIQGGIASPMGRTGLALWCALNAVACLVLARLVLVERKS